jgi:hypothetical protein
VGEACPGVSNSSARRATIIMIFIDNSERLLSAALRNRLREAYPGIPIWPLRTGVHERVPDLKRMLREKKMPYPFVKFFLISEYPFNVYEVYEQVKGILRSLSTLMLGHVSLHVVMKLNRDDVFMFGSIHNQCDQLRELFTELCRTFPETPELLFSCVYNVFGVVDAAVLHPDSNDIQSLLNQLLNPDRYVLVPFDEQEEIYGTDVHAAANSILEREEGKGGLMVLPVNAPVSAGLLMEAVGKKRPSSVRFLTNEYVTSSQVRAQLAPKNLDASLTERFIAYLE